jgi:hypothetical protein
LHGPMSSHSHLPAMDQEIELQTNKFWTGKGEMKSISRNPNPLIRTLVEQATLALGGQGARGGLERIRPGPGARRIGRGVGERAEQARRRASAAHGIPPQRRGLCARLPQTRDMDGDGGSMLSHGRRGTNEAQGIKRARGVLC